MDEQRAEFEAFVRSELGDVPVMDGGKYISPKIHNYWRLWEHASNRTSRLMRLAEAVDGIEKAATQRQQERIAALEAQVQALSLDAGRWRFAASHNAEGRLNFGAVYDAWDGDGSFTDQIDAAIAAGKGEG